MVNKKGQGTIVDLIVLVLIVSILIIFLGNQAAGRAVEAGKSRAQSAYVQRLLITTLNYSHKGTNGTIAERIGVHYCSNIGINFEDELMDTLEKLNKENHHFIFSICPEGNCIEAVCSEYIEENYDCCIKTERINIAFFNMSLPSGCNNDYIEICLGIWPKTMRVEKC